MRRQITLRTTADCNRRCRHCSQAQWKADFAGYHMTLAEVELLCRRAEELGLQGYQARLSGGEPTLWRHLEEGCRIIRQSTAFSSINLLTNADNLDVVRRLLRQGLVDVATINKAMAKQAASERLMREFLGSVHFYSTPHRPLPAVPVPGTLPADCSCERLMTFGGRMWLCNNAYTHTKRLGFAFDAPELSCGLSEDWLAHFSGVDLRNQTICSACLSNTKVWRAIQ